MMLTQRVLQSLPKPPAIKPSRAHYYPIVIVWMTAGILGLWTQAFKNYRWANYVHIFCMMVVTVISWMSGFVALVQFGIGPNKVGEYHSLTGLLILLGLTVQAGIGWVAYLSQKNARVGFWTVRVVNLLHRLCGWLVWILIEIQILSATFALKPVWFNCILIITIVCIAPYILFRLYRIKYPNNFSPKKHTDQVLTIQNSKDLCHFKDDYFIFADKIYDIKDVITNHPGGYLIISLIKTKQTDRYIYGNQPLPLPNPNSSTEPSSHRAPKHTHPQISPLLGCPLAYYTPRSLYLNMSQINQVKVVQVSASTQNKDIYTIYLSGVNDSFFFNGYRDLSQFGRYFTLGVGGVTRLYSVIEFMETVIGEKLRICKVQSMDNMNNNIVSLNEQLTNPTSQHTLQSTIPLQVKKHSKGHLTQKLLSYPYPSSMQLSKPLGFGLRLHEVTQGRVIIFVGGTGINPFCDLIDVLFKMALLDERSDSSAGILSMCPILRGKCQLAGFEFEVYAAVREFEDLYEITLYQMDYLASKVRLQVNIRCNGDLNKFKSYPNFKMVKQHFQYYIANQIKNEIQNIQKIYVCGPPKMSQTLYSSLLQNKIPHWKYSIL